MIQIRLSFHFIVSRSSPGRFLLPCFPGFSAEQMLVSKVTALPGLVVCLMLGHVYPVLSRRDTRWPGVPCHCRPTVPQCVHRGPSNVCSKSVFMYQPWSLPEPNMSYSSRREKTVLSQCHTSSLGSERAAVAGQKYFIATPKVEQLYFHRG